MVLKSISIDDDLEAANEGAVEVTLTLDDGSRRWCFFMTPEALSRVGDFVPGTSVRLHYGASHMIVVSEISSSIIESALDHLESHDELEACTRPVK